MSVRSRQNRWRKNDDDSNNNFSTMHSARWECAMNPIINIRINCIIINNKNKTRAFCFRCCCFVSSRCTLNNEVNAMQQAMGVRKCMNEWLLTIHEATNWYSTKTKKILKLIWNWKYTARTYPNLKCASQW